MSNTPNINLLLSELENLSPFDRALLFYRAELRWCWDCGRDQFDHAENCIESSQTRPTFEEIAVQMAELISKRSTCKRLKVGAIATDLNYTRVVSIGYNGNGRGLPNTCDSDTPGQCGCVHAETNCLIKAPYGEPIVLFMTLSPCLSCTKLILNSSVRKIYYRTEYRKTEHLNILREKGIEVIHLPH